MEDFPNIWPLGHGAVVLSWAKPVDRGPMLLFRAVPDAMLGVPGEPMPFADWDDLAGAPSLVLSFKDTEALDRHIAYLQEMRADLDKPHD